MKNREQKIFEMGRMYLLQFDGIDENVLDQHLTQHSQYYKKIKTLSEVYENMLQSVRSQRHMPNVIGDLRRLIDPFCAFDPTRIIETYGNDYTTDYRNIFTAISRYLEQNGGFDIMGQIEDSRNSWVKFSKSAISSAKFLSRFKDLQEFRTYTDAFTQNPTTRIGLPLILKEEIFGFGFTLACDFIKDTLSPEYVKPDTHIKGIFKGILYSREIASDVEVFEDVIKFSQRAKQVPFAVDKLFWLIGSGDFNLINIRVRTDREEFIQQVRNSGLINPKS